MTYNILTPIADGDAYDSVKSRLVTLAETFLGSGQASGGNAPSTWADMRAKLNLILAAFGKTLISAGDSGAIAKAKINGIVNTEALLTSVAILWWNADRADLVSLSGSQVTNWTDSMSGATVSQASSSLRPIYSATSFNGSPGLTFDGVDDYLAFTSGVLGAPVGGNPSEAFATVQQTALAADTGNRTILQWGGTDGFTRRSVQRAVVTGVNRGQAGVGKGSSPTALVTDTSVDFSSRHVIRQKVSATDTGVDVDGGSLVTAAVVPATAAERIVVGGAFAGNSVWSGLIRDVIITGALSGDAPTYIENFLKTRRAL
ncbi:hypothetical protein M2360_000945 [Rhizobium sp. SG_E_25_P2]|uniref:hypothetical protein n=1 Tax=Rhizobium sp. SG_E_25_P2 TaxID=2879942 RepID=UPI002475873C|nr:hypothetical protein [Rhizobium sp. SG_E_25_P2]MDH6265555.1 hypothetical protein [Rhizobium sp. SG_E_25_P2]